MLLLANPKSITIPDGDISYADNRLHINEGTQYIDDMNLFFANM